MAWRAVWLLMAVFHAPAFVSVLSAFWQGAADGGVWSRLVLLSASNLFFLLEIVFCPSLRWATDRRVVIAFLLVVAVLHAGVIERGIPELLCTREVPFWLWMSGAGAVGFSLLGRRLTVRLPAASASTLWAVRPRAGPRREFAGRRPAIRLQPLACYLCALLRAPPIIGHA